MNPLAALWHWVTSTCPRCGHHIYLIGRPADENRLWACENCTWDSRKGWQR